MIKKHYARFKTKVKNFQLTKVMGSPENIENEVTPKKIKADFFRFLYTASFLAFVKIS
jgi:hypothetical protein